MNRKSIFITGAGRGIGKTTAQLFAQKGWFVGLSDINEKELQQLSEEIGQENCSSHLMDVRNIEEIQKAFKEFSQRTAGKIHALFNNAGILFSGGFDKVSLEKHKAIVDVNFIGLMNVTHCAFPLLRDTPNSFIINMSSASALYGNPELNAYAATKSAVKSLTEGWNFLYKKHDIWVTDLMPAYVNTQMVTTEQEAMKLSDKDVKLTSDQIASAAWKAVHSKKVHHYIGTDVKLFRFLKWLLPQSIFESILAGKFYKEAILKN